MMKLLTAKELSKVLRVNPSTLRSLATRGKIKAIKVGRQYRYPFDEDYASMQASPQSK